MWIVLVVQIVLSVATLVGLFITVAWVRSSVREGRETKRLVESLSVLFQKTYGAAPAGPSAVANPSPLAVKLGAEVVELDAETLARIDALKEDVNAGRVDGRLLQRVIEAGLATTEPKERVSGEVQREPDDRDSDEPGQR